jgi:hypothetical protein
MVLIGNMDQVESCCHLFGNSDNLVQDRCMGCAECTTGMEIIYSTLVATSR